MPQVTIDRRSAEDLESKGWKKLEIGSEFFLFPPNQTIPTKYLDLLPKKAPALIESGETTKADVIRNLLKGGKSKKETIELMLKKFPECSKVSISSQVYTVANKL